MKNKKINYGVLFTVIFLIGLIAIISFGYIGYKAQLKDGEDIGFNIIDPRDILDIKGDDSSYNLNITLEKLDASLSNNNGSSFIEDTKNVTITLNTNPEKYKYPITCEYVFKYKPEVEYTSSTGKPEGVVELGIAGENNINESFGPVSIDKADHEAGDINEDGTITLTEPFKITSNPADSYKQIIWNVHYRFNNLEIDQKEIVGKSPKGKVIVESTGCYASGDDMDNQLITLLKVDPGEEGELIKHDGTIDVNDDDTIDDAGDNGYRYSGNQPNNYICFGKGSEKYNSGEESDCPLGNKYRIIGYVPVTLADGKQEFRIKVIKAEYLTEDEFGAGDGTASVDSTYDGIKRIEASQSGITAYKWDDDLNNWEESTLYKSLNSDSYLNYAFGNSSEAEEDGVAWLDKIEKVKWNVGGVNSVRLTAQKMYQEETTDGGCYSSNCNSYPIEQGSGTIISAQIGLMYAHDYGFASSSKNWWQTLYNYDNGDYSGNINNNRENNWLFNGVFEWTISRNSSYADHAIYVNYSGSVLSGITVSNISVAVRPVFYLKSDVQLVSDASAKGTKEKPLKVDPPATQINTILSTDAGDEGVLLQHTKELENSAQDNGYRYSGNQPNNYICFGKGSEAYNRGDVGATCDIKNKYRIIGYVPVTLADDSSTFRIKVIKAEYLTKDELESTTTATYNSEYDSIKRIESPQSGITSYQWDDDSNNWEESSLYKSLNSDEPNGYKSKAFGNSSETLEGGEAWLDKIEKVKCNVGGASSASLTAQKMYQAETTDGGCYSSNCNSYPIEQGLGTTVSAQIGLMYVHDYGFASSSENWWQTLYNYDNTNIENKENNWMFNGVYEWTISRYSSSADSALFVSRTGRVFDGFIVNCPYVAVRPVFYLKSDVKLINDASHNGSKEHPLRVEP